MTQNKIKAKDLPEDLREEFSELFYDLADFDDREGNPCPWGCPWYFGFTVTLKGENLAEMAKNYLTEYESDIKFTLSDEPDPEICRECGGTDDLNGQNGDGGYICSSCLSD